MWSSFSKWVVLVLGKCGKEGEEEAEVDEAMEDKRLRRLKTSVEDLEGNETM